MSTASALFPYLLALGYTAAVAALIVIVYAIRRNSRKESSYDDQLQELLLDDEEYQSVSTKPSLWGRWDRYWGDTLKGAGITRYVDDNSSAGRDVLALALVTAVLGSVITQQIYAGPLIATCAVYVTSLLMRMRFNRKNEDLNEQIPGFLFSLKANLQAADTNERAVLKVIDSMPSPLYDDLVVAKNRLLSSGSFKDAMEDLSAKTTSADLQFLCACMIQASASGANMVNQIDSIQKVLESRRQVSDEINRAVKAVQPAVWIASVTLPGLFLASYFTDSAAQNFWFVSPFSWIAIGAAVFLYVAGLMMVKQQVDKIKNM